MMKKIFLTILMLATIIFSGCVESAQGNGDLKISMLNIGHGDAILVQTGKQTVLIDTANVRTPELLMRELEKFSVTKIDKLIITHPHSDHMGCAQMLIAPSKKQLATFPYLEKISVGEVYDNGIAFASNVYKNYLKALKTKNMTAKSLKAGDTLDFGNGVKFKILFPTEEFVNFVNNNEIAKDDREHNINNGSLAGKLTYKNFSMMFTGDIEKETEAKIVASNDAKNLKCDVLKVAHHGSWTSSTKGFITAIKPSYALISCANAEKDGVPYGHPNHNVLKRHLAAGVNKQNIYCTRFNGSIVLTSDGKTFNITPETKVDWVDRWIAYRSKK